MKRLIFIKSILNLLGEMVIEYEEYHSGTLTINVKNVNVMIGDKPMDVYIKEGLEAEGFKDVWFSYGNGHWMTIHKERHQVSLGN